MEPLQPSSQNLPRGGIYPLQKKQCKFDFRSACRKTPKTTAFMCILTLISGISYIKSSFFCISVEFTFAKWNSVLQSGIYFCNSPAFLNAYCIIAGFAILSYRHALKSSAEIQAPIAPLSAWVGNITLAYRSPDQVIFNINRICSGKSVPPDCPFHKQCRPTCCNCCCNPGSRHFTENR